MPVPKSGEVLHRKLIAFDEETWNALDLYARESMKSFQELADEAFRDLLAKHGRPADLRTALRRSARPDKPAPAAAPAQRKSKSKRKG